MHIHVLGSAAGGGFPQWNCNCHNCAGVAGQAPGLTARTQSSICVSADGLHWVLINASPDVRQQILSFPPLNPRRQARDSAIAGVVLVDSQIDHCAGLLILRESQHPLDIYSTAMVRQDLSSGFPVLNMLQHYCGANWHEIAVPKPTEPGDPFEVRGANGLGFTAVPLAGKAPPYSPHREDPHPGDNIGLLIEDKSSGRSVFYAPGLAAVDTALEPILASADCLLVDGTFWAEDDMARTGVGSKTAADMGHLPQSGKAGMLAALTPYSRARRILIHINNTNPILNETSSERHQVSDVGVEIAFDGMSIEI